MMYYAFDQDRWFLVYPFCISVAFVFSLVMFIKHMNRPSKRGSDTFQWIVLCAMLGVGTGIVWGGVSDYRYFQTIYAAHTYSTVTGQLQHDPQEPDNINAFMVNGVRFRNSPRQLTSAFKGFDKFAHYVDQHANVQIAYTRSYWIPSEYAILRIEFLE